MQSQQYTWEGGGRDLYGCRVNNTPGRGVGTFMDAGSIIHLGGGRDIYGCRVNNTPGKG